MGDKTYIFIGGLHRSGTSTLYKIIGSSPLISKHENTRVPEDEGQHIQKVYKSARSYGGPGSFAFHEEYHYTENNDLLTVENKAKILQQWGRFWDLSKPILMEKSPPNIIHTLFLQELVTDSYFIIIMRHPFVVAMATKKWNNQSLEKHIEHWLIAHKILLDDKKKIKNCLILKYEELNSKTFREQIEIFLDRELNLDETKIKIIDSMQDSTKRYFNKNKIPQEIIDKYESEINKFGYSFLDY